MIERKNATTRGYMTEEARVLASAIRKGGAGKTTTIVNIAASLMLKGKRVLILDLDSQGNATAALGIERDATNATVREVLAGQVENLRDAIATKTWPEFAPGFSLDVMPSHEDLGNTELGMAVHKALAQLGVGEETTDTMQSVANLVKLLKPHYDYILLDTAPNAGPLTMGALSAADDVMIPYELGAFNDNGLTHAFKMIRKVQDNSNPDLRIHGILITKADNTTFSKEEAESLAIYKDHIYPFRVPRRTLYNQTNKNGLPAVVYAPADEATMPYMQLAEIIISE
ncbi:ParA family protein [Streptomyces sp. NPDC001215]